MYMYIQARRYVHARTSSVNPVTAHLGAKPMSSSCGRTGAQAIAVREAGTDPG